jgi:hypothetical protein
VGWRRQLLQKIVARGALKITIAYTSSPSEQAVHQGERSNQKLRAGYPGLCAHIGQWQRHPTSCNVHESHDMSFLGRFGPTVVRLPEAEIQLQINNQQDHTERRR